MDFDDLLVNTVRLLRDHPDVLEHYRERFEHILVDEYQDTNQAQNEIVLLLAGGHHNVTVVGDTDQCLPAGTLVRVPHGDVPIEQLEIGDEVAGAGGTTRHSCRHGDARPPVTHTDEPARPGQDMTSGVTLTATAHHMVPARIVPMPGSHLVYLMHRADRGYRIGRTTGQRSVLAGREAGRAPRSEQLRSTPTRCGSCVSARRVAEASFAEAWFAATYGLPTACFHANGRSLAMDDEWLQRLYDGRRHARQRAKALMQ